MASIEVPAIPLNNSTLSVDIGVLFDFIQLPDQYTAYENHVGGELWAFQHNFDPNFADRGGFNHVGNAWTPPAQIIRTGDTPDSSLMAGPASIVSYGNQVFGFTCAPLGNYTPPASNGNTGCFYHTIDTLPGSSGSAVVHRPYSHLNRTETYLAGLHQSGYVTDGWEPDINVYNSNNGVINSYGYFEEIQNPTTHAYNQAVYVDAYVSNIVPPPSSNNSNPRYKRSEGLGTGESSCQGRGCTRSPNDGSIKTYSCYGEFDPPGTSTNDQKSANAVGFVGGSSYNRETNKPGLYEINQIKGVGSLGLVCNDWKQDPYTDHWYNLEIAGIAKEGDSLRYFNPVYPLRSLLKISAIEYQNRVDAPNNEPTYRHEPLPMKLCPTPKVLQGVKITKNENNDIESIKEIGCVDPNNGSNLSWHSLYSGFNQYIGYPISSSVETLTCEEGVIVGFKTFVPNDISELQFEALSSLELICDKRYF